VRLDASVAENAALGREARFTWLGHLRRGLLRADAEALVQAADVRPPDVTRAVGTLSGGNQQKLVIARALSGEPCVVIAAHPTRGLDVGAMAEVDRRLLEARDRGAAVLVVSAELAELRAIADVIHVMYRGRLVWSGPGEAADERALGLAMAGVVDAAPADVRPSEVVS
jgi:simple sugar transport system ATP-binding protein